MLCAVYLQSYMITLLAVNTVSSMLSRIEYNNNKYKIAIGQKLAYTAV